MYQMSQGYAPQAMYGGLETITAQYSARAPVYQSSAISYIEPIPSQPTLYHTVEAFKGYTSNEALYTLFTPQQEYLFQPDTFLKPGTGGKFVGKAEDVQEFVEEAFMKLFDQQFPDDIKVSVLNEKHFRRIAPHPSTIGVSFNRRKLGLLSEIFILNDSLGRVLLTIGHEIGHVLTPTLSNPHDEEAKAYAFSLAWMEVMKKHNIAGLQGALIIEQPAENGLHNIAFRFVSRLVREGRQVWEVYREILAGKLAVAA